MTLFDMTYKQFFGRTLFGPAKTFKNNMGAGACNYDESFYICSSIKDQHILLVIELVAFTPAGLKISFAWTAFRPFIVDSNEDHLQQRYAIKSFNFHQLQVKSVTLL